MRTIFKIGIGLVLAVVGYKTYKTFFATKPGGSKGESPGSPDESLKAPSLDGWVPSLPPLTLPEIPTPTLTMPAATPSEWVSVSTTKTRAGADDSGGAKQTLTPGRVIHTILQRGVRAHEDNTNLAEVRSAVIFTRPPENGKDQSMAISVLNVVSTQELDAEASVPTLGQVFVISPDRILSIE